MEKIKKQIRWGILSAANIATRVIPSIQGSKNSVVVAIASRDLKKAEYLASRNNIANVFDSYEGVLSSDIIDAVYIPLINSLHYKWSYEALKRGINVLCEKPLTMNAEEAKRLIDFANRRKLLLREGFMYQYHPQIGFVRRLIEDKKIGQVRSIYSVFTFLNDDPESYILKKEYSGGSLMDVGCYCVHFSRNILAEEPKSVFAKAYGKEVDLSMRGIMDFGRGVQSVFESSISEYERHYAVVRGTEGEIEMTNPWSVLKESEVVLRTRNKSRVFRFSYTDTYRLQIEDFADALISGKIKNTYDSFLNMKTIDALKKSAKTGRSVKFR